MRVLAAAAILLWCGAAAAQNQSPFSAARLGFDDCFKRSALAQIKKTPAEEVDLISERAFLACATEEQALRVQMNALGPNPYADGSMVNIKLLLKGRAREWAATSQ